MPASTPPATPPASVVTSASATARPSRRLVAFVSTFVVAIALVGYAFTGSPSLGAAAASAPPPDAATADRDAEPEADRGDGRQARGAAEGPARRRRGLDDAGAVVFACSAASPTRYRRTSAPSSCSRTTPALLADYADAVAAANDGRARTRSRSRSDRSRAGDRPVAAEGARARRHGRVRARRLRDGAPRSGRRSPTLCRRTANSIAQVMANVTRRAGAAGCRRRRPRSRRASSAADGRRTGQRSPAR